MLVEVTSVDQLIDRLRKGKFRSREEVLADSALLLTVDKCSDIELLREVNKAVSDDDDIIAGHQKMSLKCPVRLDHCHWFRRRVLRCTSS